MDIFKTPQASHEHSLKTLDLLYDHDDFMDSISSVLDLGCGEGLDINWWASADIRDEDATPHNYRCFAIDKTLKSFVKPGNVHTFESDLMDYRISKPVDLVWCHNFLQYMENPAAALRKIHSLLSPGGVLILAVPQTVNIEDNRWSSKCLPGQPFSFTISNLIYMLAASGFDCHDGMFTKESDDPWLWAMVYKSELAPVKADETTWYELLQKGILPARAEVSVRAKGYLNQADLVTRWLDNSIVLWDRV